MPMSGHAPASGYNGCHVFNVKTLLKLMREHTKPGPNAAFLRSSHIEKGRKTKHIIAVGRLFM